MSRETRTNFPEAYRVVLIKSGRTTYKGPYQTLSAAKGQLTSEVGYSGASSWGYIEKTPDGWERVE